MSVETLEGHQRSSAWKEQLEGWECSLVERLCQASIPDRRHYPHYNHSILASWSSHLETNAFVMFLGKQ